MFENIEMVRKNSVYFKTDGNTVAHKVNSFYPISSILNDPEIKDLYLQHEDGNGYRLLVEVNNVLYDMKYVCLYSKEDIEKYIKIGNVVVNAEYVYNYYKNRKMGDFFNLVELEMVEAFNDEELLAFAKESRALCIKNRELRDIERKREQEEAQQKRIEENNNKVVALEEAIRNDKDIEIAWINGKVNLFYLFEKYNINVPIKVKGWISERLIKIYADGRFSYRKSCSNSFWNYYSELKIAIKK
ncbi:MAG TPA: hypothetical protein PLU55_04755 [Candidatus Pacearchaeota archaeon]|nr:hypothetical protein [Candidatus Pacearchaeota archaeon]